MLVQQSTQWYQSAVEQLTRIAAAIQRQQDFDVNRVSSLASDIAESVSRSDQLIVEALAGSGGSHLITNLLNVGIFATKVGVGLGYARFELERLALAGLVHDVGLLAVPQSLLTKAGRLTPEERMLIEQHPELGYQALRKLGTTHDWLAEVVRQAHERWNGQGYPHKLKGRQINEFAQIIGVVDVFDALVSPRSYRRRFLPHEAVRELVVVEKTAFQRKIIKALVEQLSAYPVGTAVRLSTGEQGTVIRVNTRFPLRPVVVIGEGSPDGAAAREVDLSMLPWVTIIETVEPPDVTTVSFPIRALAPPVTGDSYRFPAVLSPRNRAALDAIAHVIQEVVESVAPVRHRADNLPEGKTMWPRRHTAVQEVVSPSFEKEVVGLFALEAQVWLGQIQRALKKLTHGNDEAVRPQLYDIILQAIINLAKSAATVQLSAIEQMAMNLLPMLHDVRRQELRPARAELNSFHEALAGITAAVHHLTNDRAEERIMQSSNGDLSAIEAPSCHSLSNWQQVTAPQPIIQSSEGTEPPLLKALRALQQARVRSVHPTRDVLEAVILRAGHEAGEIDVYVIERILKDLQRLDEQFLEDVNQRVPVIIQALHNVRSQQTTGSVTASQFDPILREVDVLYELANRVQASIMTISLDGLRSFIRNLENPVQASRLLPRLRSFLLMNANKKLPTLPQWLEMVEARVQTLIPMAEQWANIGRTERADISEILRA